MPAYSKQLEDKDGNILYPITTAGSVVDEDGVDLQTRVEDAAYIGTGSVGTPSPWVDTSDLVDGAVTADKIDWSTIGAGFNRYVTTNQTAAAGTQTIIKLDGSVGTDSGVSYNSANGVFEITQPGWWVFSGGIGGAVSAATTALAGIYINSGGATYPFVNRIYHSNTTWGVYIGVSAIFKLSAGDTVRLVCEPTENQMTAINAYNRGHLVGALICPA